MLLYCPSLKENCIIYTVHSSVSALASSIGCFFSEHPKHGNPGFRGGGERGLGAVRRYTDGFLYVSARSPSPQKHYYIFVDTPRAEGRGPMSWRLLPRPLSVEFNYRMLREGLPFGWYSIAKNSLKQFKIEKTKGIRVYGGGVKGGESFCKSYESSLQQLSQSTSRRLACQIT